MFHHNAPNAKITTLADMKFFSGPLPKFKRIFTLDTRATDKELFLFCVSDNATYVTKYTPSKNSFGPMEILVNASLQSAASYIILDHGSYYHFYLYLYENGVLFCKHGNNSSEKLRDVKQICSAYSFCYILLKDNNVRVLGKYGKNVYHDPTYIPDFQDIPEINQISCSRSSVLLIRNTGSLIYKNFHHTPTKNFTKILSQLKNVRETHQGQGICYIVTESGDVYTYGSNKYGELGRPSIKCKNPFLSSYKISNFNLIIKETNTPKPDSPYKDIMITTFTD